MTSRTVSAIIGVSLLVMMVWSQNVGLAQDSALRWIEKGYSAIGTHPATEQARAIAAVLRNGSPNISESDSVVDTDSGGFWTLGASGWEFRRGKPASRPRDVSIQSYIGVEGSRALVSVDTHCGLLCGIGYHLILRKEDGEWKVQAILQSWIS